MKAMLQRLGFAIAVASLSASASAAVIQSPTAATASSTFAGCCAIERTIDQSGLSGTFTSGISDFDAYLATNPLHGLVFSNEWFSDNATTATVTFDMGAAYTIDRMAYWNEDAANGPLQFNASGSTDGVTFGLLAANLVPTDHAANTDYPADVFGWAPQSLRYIRLEMTCTWCAIGEVAFSVTSASVPEPGSLALFGFALAGLGFARCRKQH